MTVLLQSNKEKIQELAKTHGEFGNGVGHGATAAVKIMGQIQKMTGQDNRATLAVVVMDLSGAFPNTPRSVLRSQLKTHLPVLVPLSDVMYGSPNKHRILKDDGFVHELTQFDRVTQGPETPLCFSCLSPCHFYRAVSIVIRTCRPNTWMT